MPDGVLVNVNEQSDKIRFGVDSFSSNIFLKKRSVSLVLFVESLATSVEESSRIV